jgi:hypothetical protein
VNAAIILPVTKSTGKLSSGYTTGGLSISAHLHRVSWLVRQFACFLFS